MAKRSIPVLSGFLLPSGSSWVMMTNAAWRGHAQPLKVTGASVAVPCGVVECRSNLEVSFCFWIFNLKFSISVLFFVLRVTTAAFDSWKEKEFEFEFEFFFNLILDFVSTSSI